MRRRTSGMVVVGPGGHVCVGSIRPMTESEKFDPQDVPFPVAVTNCDSQYSEYVNLILKGAYHNIHGVTALKICINYQNYFQISITHIFPFLIICEIDYTGLPVLQGCQFPKTQFFRKNAIKSTILFQIL